MKRHRIIASMTLLLLLATPTWAVFVERFEPVWEEQGGGDGQSWREVLLIPIEDEASSEEKRGGAPSGRGNEGFTDLTTGMEFVLVKGGCFSMGSNDGGSDERPVHEVCVDDFYLGKFEVTQGQWQKVTGSNPSSFKKDDDYPVESVSWDDTQLYLRQLNQKSSSKSFRLPTEAEWEYAARSGGQQEKYAGGDNVDAVAWYDKNSGRSTHPVGQKQANGLGLYDVSGNVWEWTGDKYDSDYYGQSPKQNPTGTSVSFFGRVYRGGSWNNEPGGVRSAVRSHDAPTTRYATLGFRLAFPAR